MSRTITIDIFDPASIDAAVREIRDYSKWVTRKTEELRERVAELIRNHAEPLFQSAIAQDNFKSKGPGDDNFQSETPRIGGDVIVTVECDDNVTLVVAHGKDAIFIEFGAGVYHNTPVGSSPHPLGGELGFTIGSYGPNGAHRTWGYAGDDGRIYLTHGVPASMPLYRAVQSVTRDIVQIAREVFGND